MAGYKVVTSALRTARSEASRETVSVPVEQEESSAAIPTLDELVAECRSLRVRQETEWYRQRQELASAAAPESPREVSGNFGYFALRIRAGALIAAVPDAGALANAGAKNIRRDLEVAFADAGLVSEHAVLGAAPPRPGEEAGEEEDVWRGLGWE